MLQPRPFAIEAKCKVTVGLNIVVEAHSCAIFSNHATLSNLRICRMFQLKVLVNCYRTLHRFVCTYMLIYCGQAHIYTVHNPIENGRTVWVYLLLWSPTFNVLLFSGGRLPTGRRPLQARHWGFSSCYSEHHDTMKPMSHTYSRTYCTLDQ